MHTVKFVIFDLDGTLVDSFDELVAATNHVRTTYGLRRFSDSEVKKMLAAGGPRLVEKALPGASTEELERATALYLDYSDRNLLSATYSYSGLTETLDELKRNGIIMAITSNKFSTLSRKVLKHFGIDSYFSAVVGPDTFPIRKPSPDFIPKLAREFRLAVDEGAIVGDSVSDIMAGKKAGVATVGCTYGYGSAFELTDADYRISSLPELLTLPSFGNLCDLEKEKLRQIV